MGLPENIDALLVKFDINQDALARVADVSPSTVTRWRQGAQMRKEPLSKICAYFDLKEDDLLATEGGLASKEHSPAKTPHVLSMTEVPLFGSIAAGTPLDMESCDVRYLVPTDVISRHPGAFLLKVEGESMNRVLPNGCYALVEPCSDVRNDNMPYAVCVNGYSATIKRIHRLSNGFELVPDSIDPTYRPKVYDYGDEGTETISIIGEVVWYCLPPDWSF